VEALSESQLDRSLAADADADIPKPEWTRARLILRAYIEARR
jgi:hypothetical protein